jgi:hypothetical protein
MRTLLYVIAILLIAAGVAVGLGSFYAPGQVVIGLNLESAAILLTGGFIMLGLATVTAALLAVAEALAGSGARSGSGALGDSFGPAPPGADKSWPGNYGRRKSKTGGDLPGFLRPARGGPATAGAPSPPGLGPAQPPSSPGGLFPDKPPPRKSEPIPTVITTTVDSGVPNDLQAAVEREAPSLDRPYPPEPEVPAEPVAAPATPPAAAASSAEAPEASPTSEDQLFVIEERLVRGKVARVLSDGTVEAETAEGWMRFENVEHLEEYLQAMGEV